MGTRFKGAERHDPRRDTARIELVGKFVFWRGSLHHQTVYFVCRPAPVFPWSAEIEFVVGTPAPKPMHKVRQVPWDELVEIPPLQLLALIARTEDEWWAAHPGPEKKPT